MKSCLGDNRENQERVYCISDLSARQPPPDAPGPPMLSGACRATNNRLATRSGQFACIAFVIPIALGNTGATDCLFSAVWTLVGFGPQRRCSAGAAPLTAYCGSCLPTDSVVRLRTKGQPGGGGAIDRAGELPGSPLNNWSGVASDFFFLPGKSPPNAGQSLQSAFPHLRSS